MNYRAMREILLLLATAGWTACSSSGGGANDAGFFADDAGGGSCDVVPPPFRPDVPDELPTVAGIDYTKFPALPDLSLPAAGREWHVSTDGDDSREGSAAAPLRTIVEAVRRAAAGDKVMIHDGRYAEGDEETGKGISTAKDGLIVTSAPGEIVIIEPKRGFTYGINITADRVVLNGLLITGFSTVAVELGGDGTPLEGVVLSNLTVEAESEGIVSYADLNNMPEALAAEGLVPAVDGLLLENVSITGATLLGFSCDFGPCNNVRMNHVGVLNMDTGSGDSGSDCIAFERGDNLVFYYVAAHRCEGDGIDLKASRVLIYNSHIYDTRRNGIKVWRGGDIVNTVVSHTGADAAIVFDGPGAYRLLNSLDAFHLEGREGAYTMTVAHDTVCGVSDPSCGASSGAPNCCETTMLPENFAGLLSVELTNNVFVHASGLIFIPTGAGLTVRNNLFAYFAGGEDVFEVRDTGGRKSVSGIEQEGWGSGNIPYGTDPGFFISTADPREEDLWNWRPRPESPLVDSGVIPDQST